MMSKSGYLAADIGVRRVINFQSHLLLAVGGKVKQCMNGEGLSICTCWKSRSRDCLQRSDEVFDNGVTSEAYHRTYMSTQQLKLQRLAMHASFKSPVATLQTAI